jgi:hypothetical protein
LHEAKGEPVKAKEYLEKALADFEGMGMTLWIDKCQTALQDLNT